MRCPLQAKYHYVDHLPGRQNGKASWGVCIHHALEVYNQRGDLERALEVFKDVWRHPEKLDVAIDYWPKMTDYSRLRTRGIEILKEYHDKQRWDTREVIATEHRFLVPIGKHEFTGVIDLLEVKKSGKGKNVLRIIDYKGTSKRPTMAELFMNIQFTIYVYATQQPEFWVGDGSSDFPGLHNGQWLWDTYRDMARRPIWYHLWNNSEMDAGERSQQDFERMYRLMDEVEKAWDAGIFVPDISAESCGICDYVDPCGLVIPTAVDVMEQEDAWI